LVNRDEWARDLDANREKGRPQSGDLPADQPSDAPRDPGTSVRFSITVDVDIDRAFRVFTEQMTSWWPPEHHINAAPLAAALLEPRVGGRWYELGTDGSECEWGVVLAWDPPRHVAVSWHLDGDFQRYERDLTRTSRVDVRFRSLGRGSTLVELEHSGLDRHGPSWRRLRDAISSPGGWHETLRRFAVAASR
jgi:uncharacterized protein YndB with AHSA1/START domain